MQKFVEDITIRNLNPHNFALCNDFQDNLWGFAINILPELGKHIYDIKIIKCFLSESYIRKELLKQEDKYNWKWKKYSYGLAMELTWGNWSFEKALAISNAIFEDYPENTHCVINLENKTLEILRKMKDKRIKEVTKNLSKTIRKRD